MRKIILFSIFFITSVHLKSQFIIEDANGESSVVYPSGAIGFNIVSSKISSTFLISDQKTKLFFGYNIAGTNNENIANFFDKGFSKSANMELVLGKNFDLFKTKKRNKLDSLAKIISLRKDSIQTAFAENLISKIRLMEKEYPNNDTLLQYKGSIVKLREKYKNKEDRVNDVVKAFLADVSTKSKNSKMIKIIEDEAKKINDKIIYNDRQKQSEAQMIKLILINDTIPSEQIIPSRKKISIRPYFTYGLSGLEFNAYNESSPSITDRFMKNSHIGSRYSLGVNFDFTSCILGVRMKKELATNFNLLSKKTFTIRNISEQDDVQLITEEQKIAYAGLFQDYSLSTLQLDFIKYVNIDNSKSYLNLHVYLRACLKILFCQSGHTV